MMRPGLTTLYGKAIVVLCRKPEAEEEGNWVQVYGIIGHAATIVVPALLPYAPTSTVYVWTFTPCLHAVLHMTVIRMRAGGERET